MPELDLAELERLREERDALAAQVEYICDELEDDCDVTDGPGGPRPNRAMRLRADIHRHYATHVRTYQQILAARDAAVQAEVTELKAANVKLAAALEEYGQHSPVCACAKFHSHECTCGFDRTRQNKELADREGA